MPYTIARYNGTVLTTIPDGTINTTASSLNLPGKNYAGYGLPVDEDLVYLLENFAGPNVPANPLTGQLWFNTTDSEMYICPIDGEANAAQWIRIVGSGGNGGNGNTVIGGTLTLTGNVPAISTTTGTMQISGIGGAGIGGNMYAGGGVYGSYIVGDGGNIANINGANVTGTTANTFHANVADFASNPLGSTWQVLASSNATPSGTVANVCVTYNGPGGDNSSVSVINGNALKGLTDSRGVNVLTTTGAANAWALNAGNATISGTASVGTLGVSGNATVSGNLTTTGAEFVGTNLTVASNATIIGAVKCDNYQYANGQPLVTVPSGVIVMWSGAAGTIPSGWALCNGGSGTPNLIGRFVLAADDSSVIHGAVGGSTSIQIANLPSHNHDLSNQTISFSGGTTGGGGAHSHGVSDPGHSHSFNVARMGSPGTGGTNVDLRGGGGSNCNLNPGGGTNGSGTGIGIQGVGDHVHSMTGTATIGSGSTGYAGGNAAYWQPYYALCYIMKL